MIDVTGPKVLLPATLFVMLTPDVLTRLVPGTDQTTAVLFGSLIFVILYSLLARVLNLVLTKTDLIVSAALYIVLTPRVLVSIPDQPGLTPVMVHALVYAVLFAIIRMTFPQYY